MSARGRLHHGVDQADMLLIDHAAGKYATRSAAGDRRAKTAEARETDKILRDEGYPAAQHWTNDKTQSIFGRCSKPHHRLLVIEKFHADRVGRKAFVEQWEAEPAGVQGCRPYQDIEERASPYTKDLGGTCRYCKSELSFGVIASRLIAISKLEHSELWKAVLPRRNSKTKTTYVFEGSARCNGFGHEGHNHCMTPSHLNMETFKHNARHKKHHRGITKCYCYRLYVGKRVKPDPEGGCCDSVFSGNFCENFFRRRTIE